MLRFASNEEIAEWDQLVLANPDGGHIYQSHAWGEFKSDWGWRPLRLIFEHQKAKYAIQLIAKSVPFIGTIYYCPKGPGFFAGAKANRESAEALKAFTREATEFLRSHDKTAVLLKIEPEVEDGAVDLHALDYVKAKSDLQFKATIIVDISAPEEELLAAFKQKTRYNIRLAEKKGVCIERLPMDEAGVELMYKLMQATQERAGFFLRSQEYFGGYWQALWEANLAQFFVARHEGEVLAGIYATVFGHRAYYKDGGSFPIKRNLMAPYLLQWEAMRWAKSRGAVEYDMVAVPPKSELNNPQHHQAGLYSFKRMFSEEVTEFVGCWDLPLSSKYKLWRKYEGLYGRVYARLNKNLFW